MFECPPEMPFEECLKRQMASKKSSSSLSTPSVQQSSGSNPLIVSKARYIGMSGGLSSGSSNTTSSYSSGGNGGGGFGFLMGFGNSGGSFSRPNPSSGRGTASASKGGVVVNKQTVIVKSNFEMAGRLNKQGKRNNAKTLGSHASASLTYIENHGARDLEQSNDLSNIYDANGERMSKEEFNELKQKLNEGVGAFRRTVIDVGHNELDREDMNRLVRESLQQFQEQTGKQFDYAYAIHTDTDHIHAHVLSYGNSHEINMTKEHLQLFKQTVGAKTDELLQEHKLDNARDLSLHQQIDKSIDGVLDDKENQQQTHKASLSL
ncbi:MAG: hypothetical protein PHV10_01180 [Sulfuricurvum sp.]|nr:hypothetical protein [Sulfuricurvum sp.]